LSILRIEKFANLLLLFFVFDTGEEFGAELRDRFRFVERQLVINLPTLEVTRLAASLKDRLDVGIKVWSCRRRRIGNQQFRLGCSRIGFREQEIFYVDRPDQQSDRENRFHGRHATPDSSRGSVNYCKFWFGWLLRLGPKSSTFDLPLGHDYPRIRRA